MIKNHFLYLLAMSLFRISSIAVCRNTGSFFCFRYGGQTFIPFQNRGLSSIPYTPRDIKNAPTKKSNLNYPTFQRCIKNNRGLILIINCRFYLSLWQVFRLGKFFLLLYQMNGKNFETLEKVKHRIPDVLLVVLQ